MPDNDPSVGHSRDALIAEVRRRAGKRRLRRRATIATVGAVGAAISVAVPLALAGGGQRATINVIAPPTSVLHNSAPPTTASPTTSTVAPTSPPAPYDGPKLTSVSRVVCADAMRCWAGAFAGPSGEEIAILASTDGGATWTVQHLIPGVVTGIVLACPSDTHCLAAANRGVSNQPPLLISTTNGGMTWSTLPEQSQVYEADAVSCVNESTCWLVGAQPSIDKDLVLATSDWGGSWSVQDRSSIQHSMGVGFGISCPSSSNCVIVGGGALTTTNGGSTWQHHSVPGELNVVSCPSVSLCVAEEDVTSAIPAKESTTIAISGDGGSTWKVVGALGGNVGVLGSLSCPAISLCFTVGNGYTYTSGGPPNGQTTFWGAIEKSTDGGQTWTVTKATQATNLFGVSCAPNTTDCVAVGAAFPANGPADGSSSAGVILRTGDGGSTWTQVPLPGADEPTLGHLVGAIAHGSGFGQVRPTGFSNGGDPTGAVGSISWGSWGTPTATGTGVSEYVAPDKSPSQGTQEPVTVVAFDLGYCDGRYMYQKVDWYFPQHGQSFNSAKAENICTG